MKSFLSLLIVACSFISAQTTSTENPLVPEITLENPVDMHAKIISEFGIKFHPVLNEERRHDGVDFKTSIGDEIHAAAKGEVIFMDQKGTYGNLIEIKHENGFITRYAHLSGFQENLKKGMKVNTGDLIAYAGNTGLVQESILHFEVIVDGKAADPSLYLK